MIYLLLIFMTTMFIQISTIKIVRSVVCTIFNKFIKLASVSIFKDIFIVKYGLGFVRILERYMFKERGSFITYN